MSRKDAGERVGGLKTNYSDKMVLKDCRRRNTNLAMAWIDYRKAYDMIPHSWITECLEMFGIVKKSERFIRHSMSQWKTELTSCGETLRHVQVRRDIFHGDSLSPLLFVLCVIPCTESSIKECESGTRVQR